MNETILCEGGGYALLQRDVLEKTSRRGADGELEVVQQSRVATIIRDPSGDEAEVTPNPQTTYGTVVEQHQKFGVPLVDLLKCVWEDHGG